MTTRETLQAYFTALQRKDDWARYFDDSMHFTSLANPVRQLDNKAEFLKGTERFYWSIAHVDVRELLVDGERLAPSRDTASSCRTAPQRSTATLQSCSPYRVVELRPCRSASTPRPIRSDRTKRSPASVVAFSPRYTITLRSSCGWRAT